MVAALLWINADFAVPSYIGPISSHFPGLQGGDLSWAIGIVVGGGVYYLLAAPGYDTKWRLWRAPRTRAESAEGCRFAPLTRIITF